MELFRFFPNSDVGNACLIVYFVGLLILINATLNSEWYFSK